MEVELKLANLKSVTDKPFVYIPKKLREMAGITGPTSVIITLRELKAGGKVYGYCCKILKKDGASEVDDTDFTSNIGKHGLIQLPPKLARVKRMALEYDKDYKCLVLWAYID